MRIHDDAPPQVAALLAETESVGLRYVLVGSVAAMVHGVDLEPSDLDIVPAVDTGNLERLAELLGAIEARTPGPFGAWTTLENGERKWIARETSQSEIEAWRPDPGNIESFDHCFRTRFGNFDVVPELTGRYEDLVLRSARHEAFGQRPRVALISELLARLTVPRREKDRPRVLALRELQRSAGGLNT